MTINYQMRNGIVMVLQDAIMRWNNGDAKTLSNVLGSIHDTEGYTARHLIDEREIDGIVYTIDDVVFEILEDGEPLFSIYRDKRDNMMVLEVYSVDLMSVEEVIEELQLKAQIREELGECV